ncbi:MAG: hypothetical protein JST16_13990 [Bdellovibrionales bacterium]|nr:hypothetical protein [Bdellovibrionales bacterium]
MAPTKKKTAVKKTVAKKAKAPAKKKAVAADKAAAPQDRRGLAARARQLKSELLAIRFNLQAPNLTEYRTKRRELATVLRDLA